MHEQPLIMILTLGQAHVSAMSYKQGGNARPLKQPKVENKDSDEVDMANTQKVKEAEKALRELRAKAQQKGYLWRCCLKKSGKK